MSDPVADREDSLFAPYAMRSADTRGRIHDEPLHPYRGPFQRDRDRIIHSSAFRRLAHKTQVLTGDMGDYHRSRLTHTLEVASIARTVARALRLNEDFVEALAVLHDLGHPPFGHAGEDVLHACLDREGAGAFSHNVQALRIVEKLERRYPEFPGLNLSREVLAGQQSRVVKEAVPFLEVQVVDAADSIAYDAHDADDAVELGLLSLADLDAAPLWRTAARRVRSRFAALDDRALRRSVVHEILDMAVSDLVESSVRRLSAAQPASADEARRASERLIVPSSEIAEQKDDLERLLFARVYRHEEVLEQRQFVGRALREMFGHFVAHPDQLPAKFQALAGTEGLPRAVADYLAGMTDRFALEEHDRLVVPRSVADGASVVRVLE